MTQNSFDKHATSSYAEGLSRQVPGYSTLLPMVSQLLAERTPTDSRILVLGAGGGQEILALANAHAGWSFDGVDPSSKMLQLAAQTIEPHASRVQLHEGYISDTPQGPFDAATSILVFHFIPLEQRLKTLIEIRQRLKKAAPFILVHLSFPQTEPERSLWIARHVAFSQSHDADPTKAKNARQAIRDRLTIISPEDEEAMLRQAGFSNASLFYAGMSIKGWIAYAD